MLELSGYLCFYIKIQKKQICTNTVYFLCYANSLPFDVHSPFMTDKYKMQKYIIVVVSINLRNTSVICFSPFQTKAQGNLLLVKGWIDFTEAWRSIKYYLIC